MVRIFIQTVLFALILQGCQPSPDDQAVLPGQNEIIAKVNGSEISRYQLEQAAIDTLGIENSVSGNRPALDKVYQKLLQSLVMMRAVSQEAQRVLPAKKLIVVEQKVLAYREEILAKAYLKQFVEPQPVTQQMVEEYYQSHPEKFGGQTARQYQLLAAMEKLSGNARQRLTLALNNAATETDWDSYAQAQNKLGIRMQFRQGNSGDKLLQQPLRNVLQQTEIGQVSKPFYLQGRLYVVKVTSERNTPAKPLHEVSSDIRKSLVPIQLHKAVEEITKPLIEKSTVELLLKQ